TAHLISHRVVYTSSSLLYLSLSSIRCATFFFFFFFFTDPAPTEIYTLSLHDALPICFFVTRPLPDQFGRFEPIHPRHVDIEQDRSEEHTSELQSLRHLVCRLLLEKKKKKKKNNI